MKDLPGTWRTCLGPMQDPKQYQRADAGTLGVRPEQGHSGQYAIPDE